MQSLSIGASGRTALALSLLIHVAPVAAQDAAEAEDAAEDGPELEEVIVTAHPLSGEGLSEAVVVLEGERLERELADSIGATIARQPGIHSASFGEAVGRPVVHGLSGPRVRVMEDRIDAMDASSTSGDHAVTVDPFLADQVEVLKGPSTLLYGSGAIGGVVGVHTGRIPRERSEGLSGRTTVRAADNGRGRSAGLRLDGGGKLAWHIDAFTRSADEYDIPSFAESARFRAAEEAEEEEEDHDEDEHHDEDEDEHEGEDEHEEEEAFGYLPNSQSDGRGGAIGASWIGERGFVGVAFSRLDYDYGLPGGSHAHGHEDEHEEEHDDEHEAGEEHEDEDEHEDEHEDEEHEDEAEGGATLDMEQTRFDFEAGVENPFANVSMLNLRFGNNDYSHVEIEPNGEVGTRFAVDSYEGRIELAQDDGIGLDGVAGVQFGGRSFSAIGEEAYVPPVDTSSIGVFMAAERDFEGFELETGARIERVRHEPSAGADTSFSALSASIGFVMPAGTAQLGLHGGYSSRAPQADELYANGPHLATGSFDVGDPNLDMESAWHGSATLAWVGSRGSITATAYATAFRDYIYTYADGTVEDDLPVIRYRQADAQLRGLDLAASVTVAEFDGGSAALTFLADTVAASVDVSGNDNLPRLPPARLGLGLRLERGRYSADLDYVRTFERSDTADLELPTDAYEDLRLHLATEYDVGNASLRLFLQGRNLTDAEQRHHTSLIKDLAPAPGRTLVVGAEVAF